jgi:hypothetical protein
MTALGDMRTGIATNLSTVSGLRTSSFIPDTLNPPVAVVAPDTITFDQTFGRGQDRYTFSVEVVVGRVSDRASQNLMDNYCDPNGSKSIKAAIESDPTLGGKVFDCRVTEVRGYQQIVIADVLYLSVVFSIDVLTN